MAEAEVPIASPLYSEGVHHAEVSSPMYGVPTPDPLGWLSSSPPGASIVNKGGGDGTNDWKEMFPDDAGESGG